MSAAATSVIVLHKIGDVVPQSGMYLCVPCGFVQEFKEGEQFTECLACLAGTPYGPEGYQHPDAEFWEFIG
jgi:hypothetical protein